MRLSDKWQQCAAAIPANAPEEHKTAMEQAFYAGAAAAVLPALTKAEGVIDLLERLDEVSDELLQRSERLKEAA